MTEQEKKLIENLTKQLEISNRISLKQMQESNMPSLNEERLTENEIALMNAKKHFFEKSATLLSTINIFIGIFTIFVFIALLVGITTCASNY